MRKTVLSGAIALSLLSLNAQALSVGEMNVSSHLGEALDVSIDLSAATKSELSTLEVSLASRESFEQAGIRYPQDPRDLIIEVDTTQKGKPRILVKSINSISEPFVHLLLQITWAGGNMLREYTALIDPVEYTPNPVAQAAASNTQMGAVKPANGADTLKTHGMVESGDTLSKIASIYRPKDVSVHQAWMAFYELNRHAFPDNNLNRIKKGSEIRVPTRAQMTAISASKAAQEVKRLSKPLAGKVRAKPVTSKAEPKPKLVVGGDTEEPAGVEKPAEPAPTPTTDTPPAKPSADSGQIANVTAEFGAFKQEINQRLDENSEQNAQFKEELVAARGESRVLNERIAELEKQLSNIGRLIELQSEAMQALNENLAKGAQMQQMGDGQKAPAVSPGGQMPVATPSDGRGGTPPVDSGSPDQTGGASEQIQTGEPQSIASQEEVQTKIVQSDQDLESLKKDYEEQLAVQQQELERAQQQEQSIIAQAESDAAQAKNAEQPPQPKPAPAAPATEPQATQAPQTDSPVRVAAEPAATQVPAEQSFMDKAMGMVGSIGAVLGGISADIWKIIGVLAAALLGLFAYNSSRRRRAALEEEEDYEFSTLEDTDAAKEMGDTSQQMMMDESVPLTTADDDQPKDKLHGSSLFDLSDESFMASEAVDNDSSMFTMNEESAQDAGDKTNVSGSSAGTDLHSSIPTATNIDPVTEADVYLAYERKEQAINVLEQALEKNPNQAKVVLKLLTLHREANNVDAFTKVFESSAEHVENDDQWDEIKQLAQDFITVDKLEDDFESSIPVLQDELVEVQQPQEASADNNPDDDSGVIDFETPGPQDGDIDFEDDAAENVEKEESLADVEPEALTLSDDMALSIEEEMESEASIASEIDGLHAADGEMLSDITHDIGFDIDQDEPIALEDEGTETVNESAETKAEPEPAQEDNLDEVSEINQHDPETALALANAYIELGENDIAKDFLNDAIVAGSKKVRGKAEKLLATLN